jgi:ferric-dicitrate binding protein FerR (iron transport regulator)
MRGYLSIVGRIGNFVHFRALFFWSETSGVRWPTALIGSFLSLLAILTHFWPQWTHEVQPYWVHLRTALHGSEVATPLCAPFGGRRSIHLKEGTSIELDSGACIVPEITATGRLLKLESGEAIFQVAPDPIRPFVVETGPLAIRVLGTQFDVYRQNLATRVSVIQGKVQVSSRNQTSSINSDPLTALQQLEVPDDTAYPRVRRTITDTDFERITAWLHGSIELNAQTLAEAFKELQRYQQFQIEFKGSRSCEMRLSGHFHTNDLESFLALLKVMHIQSDYDKAHQHITLTCDSEQQARPRA